MLQELAHERLALRCRARVAVVPQGDIVKRLAKHDTGLAAVRFCDLDRATIGLVAVPLLRFDRLLLLRVALELRRVAQFAQQRIFKLAQDDTWRLAARECGQGAQVNVKQALVRIIARQEPHQ